MTTIPKPSFKAQLLPLLKKQLTPAKKLQLKTALQKITSKSISSSTNKTQLIDQIANQLYPIVMNFKSDIDGVNRALECLKNWFRTQFGLIIKSTAVEGFQVLLKKEFKGIDVGRLRATKLNQIIVENTWSEQKPAQYPCICPKAPSNLCAQKCSQKCYICGTDFHLQCLWGRAKNQKCNTLLNQCPSCFLTNCITHKHVQKVLFSGYLPTTKSNKLQFHINFFLPLQYKSSPKHFLQARCIRLKPQADYNRYQITWPDNSTLHFNNRKAGEFKLMAVNSAVKRRGDEEVVLDKGNAYCDGLQTFVIQQKHEYDACLNKYDFASHFVMVMVVRQQTDYQLMNKFNHKRLSIPESKAILKNYLNSNSSTDIQVEKFSVSLRCPLYFTKITIPVRSKHCSSHFQPFDLKNFLTINRTLGKGSAQKYKCPICKKRAYDLVIDDYLSDLMGSKNNGQNVTEISFRADGEPHFEQEVVEGSSDEEGPKPQKQQQQEKPQHQDNQKIVEQFQAIDIDLESPVQPDNNQQSVNQNSLQIVQKPLQLAKLQDERKITSLIQPNKPVTFGEKKTPGIFDRIIQSKPKIPQKINENSNSSKRNDLNSLLGEISLGIRKGLSPIIPEKSPAEKGLQEKDNKIVQQKQDNEEKIISIPKSATNWSLIVNNLPQRPINITNKTKDAQENRQIQPISKGSNIMQLQLPSNNPNNQAIPTSPNIQDISNRIIEEKPNIEQEQRASSAIEMIEISSDESNDQKQSRPIVQKKKSGKELKHQTYTIKDNPNKKGRSKQQKPATSTTSIAKKPLSKSKPFQKPSPKPQQKSQQDSYQYQYLQNSSQIQRERKSQSFLSHQMYYGQSQQPHSKQPQKKRNFIKQINQHMKQGRKKVKMDEEKQGQQVECIELLSDEDERAIYNQQQQVEQLEDQLYPLPDHQDQNDKIQLEAHHPLNCSQTILQQQQAQTKQTRYHSQLNQLRLEMQQKRKMMERNSSYNKVSVIKQDDQKMFYELLEELNKVNGYEVFC